MLTSSLLLLSGNIKKFGAVFIEVVEYVLHVTINIGKLQQVLEQWSYITA